MHTFSHTLTQLLIHSAPPPSPWQLQSSRSRSVPDQRGESRPQENQLQMWMELTSGRPLAWGPGDACQGASGEGNCLHSGPEPSLLMPTLWVARDTLSTMEVGVGGGIGDQNCNRQVLRGAEEGGGQDRTRKIPETAPQQFPSDKNGGDAWRAFLPPHLAPAWTVASEPRERGRLGQGAS